MEYRKKPVVIEAWQWNGYWQYEPDWLLKALTSKTITGKNPDGSLDIKTLEDGMDGRAKHVVNLGDWIIQGIKGELYACKPDIFEATYEPVIPSP